MIQRGDEAPTRKETEEPVSDVGNGSSVGKQVSDQIYRNCNGDDDKRAGS